MHVRNSLADLDDDLMAKQRKERSGPAQYRYGMTAPIRDSCALSAPDAHLRKSVSMMCFAVCKLSAARVSVGLAVAPVGNVLLPTT